MDTIKENGKATLFHIKRDMVVTRNKSLNAYLKAAEKRVANMNLSLDLGPFRKTRDGTWVLVFEAQMLSMVVYEFEDPLISSHLNTQVAEMAALDIPSTDLHPLVWDAVKLFLQ